MTITTIILGMIEQKDYESVVMLIENMGIMDIVEVICELSEWHSFWTGGAR